jgi:protease I
LIVAVLAAMAFGQPPTIPVAPAPAPDGKPERTVLVYLPQQLYSGDEFEPALRQLSLAGVKTRIATADTGVAVSMTQVLVRTDLTLRDSRVEDYDGFVLIGGSGAALHWDDSLLHARCREFVESGRVVAAIGIAPITLARAGLLKGRKATVFHERNAIEWLRQAGARFSFRDLVVDRNVITAASAEQARAFGRTISRVVQEARAAPQAGRRTAN